MTELEVFRVSDFLSIAIWAILFLEAQGSKMNYRNDTSAMRMLKMESHRVATSHDILYKLDIFFYHMGMNTDTPGK